jgi:hypothetical protein
VAADDDNTRYKDGGVHRLRRIFPGDGEVSVELPLWDSVAQEPARLAGLPLRLHSVRRSKNRHPLYAEPSVGEKEWEFSGPWEVYGALEYDQINDDQVEGASEGIQEEADATLWVARKEFDDIEAPDPKPGDVVDFWERQPFNRRQFQYWDVINAQPGGNVFNAETFTMWKLTLKHRTRFSPKRKVEGTTV